MVVGTFLALIQNPTSNRLFIECLLQKVLYSENTYIYLIINKSNTSLKLYS